MGTDGINSKSRSNFWRPQISVPLPLWTAAYFHNCHNINITSCQSNSHCSPFRAGKKRIPIGSHFILVLSCYKISNQKCFLPSSVYSLNLKYQKTATGQIIIYWKYEMGTHDSQKTKQRNEPFLHWIREKLLEFICTHFHIYNSFFGIICKIF